MKNLDEYRDYVFILNLGPEGMPYDFRIRDLLDDEFEVADMTKEEKLDMIDALILDVQDYRKKVEKEDYPRLNKWEINLC